MAPNNISYCTRCFTSVKKGMLHIHEYQELCDECNDALYPKNKEIRVNACLIHKLCGKRMVLREVAMFDGKNSISIAYKNALAVWCNTCKAFIMEPKEIRELTDSERCPYM